MATPTSAARNRLVPIFQLSLLALLAVELSAGPAAESFRQEIEADWQRQNAARMALIVEPGTVRFAETQIEWPGVKATGRGQVTWRPLSSLGFGKNQIALEVTAPAPSESAVEVTVECVVFTAQRPAQRVLFEGELGVTTSAVLNCEIAHEGPAAIVVTERAGGTAIRDGRAFFVEPVAETLARAERLVSSFGVPLPEGLDTLKERASRLAERERTVGPDPESRAEVYREARWLARRVAFSNPLLRFRELLVVKRFTQETYPDVCLNHMPWVSRPGGDLCVLAARLPGESLLGALEESLEGVDVRHLVGGALGPGHVHGADLSWNAQKVVFGYARAKSTEPPEGWLDRRQSYRLRRTEEPTHIFEIGVDGRGLRQLTDGEWSDLDPTYLPDGGIAFASERCGYSLQCNELDKDETSCNLYRMESDGSDIRRLSVTKDGDYLPHTLGDGTLGYTRWEYQERGWAHIQSIWNVRPDGTGEDAIFKQHFNDPWALEDVRSVPGSRQLIAVAAGHHTLAVGPVVLIEPGVGLNNPQGIRIVTPGVLPPEGGMSGQVVAEGGVPGRGGYFTTPWPVSSDSFLVSRTYGKETDATGYAIYLIDVFGTNELVYRDPTISCFTPIPLVPRSRPMRLADAAEFKTPFATCVVSDVSRGVEGISPGQARYLRISQRLAWPYDNEHGGQRYEPDVKSVMVNWTPVRVIGEVALEEDGSASFRVPVDTPLYFQLLDERHMELRRMRSFVSFQPGEFRGCVGCHETRAEAPAAAPFPLALRDEPAVPAPPPWGDRPLSFLRDVQPVFDRHCVRCHGGLKPDGDVDLSGGLTERHNRAYDTIQAHGLIARSNVGEDAKVTPPLAFGSHKSKLIAALGAAPHAKEVQLNEGDWLRLVTWIDGNAPYHDGFIDKRPETAPYDLAKDSNLRSRLESVHSKRCRPCHEAAEVSRIDWIDMQEPRRSRFLTAPLATRAGGKGQCRRRDGASDDPGGVYAVASDPDYRLLLDAVEAAVEQVWSRPRRDVRALERKVRTVRRLPPERPVPLQGVPEAD